jgi:ferritin-like metal-binding protein YciE
VKVSSRRDLVLQLLGELLYVERRLTGGVLRELAMQVRDDTLRGLLEEHLEQTRAHVERCEVAFRRLEASPSANRSAPFEAAVAEHDELAPSIVSPALADVFHAQAALRTEHLEIALYTALLAFERDELAPLHDSLVEERKAREAFERELRRLIADAG